LQKAEPRVSSVFKYAQMGTVGQVAENQTACHSYKRLSHRCCTRPLQKLFH